jgi:hypothetical protein
MRRRAASRTLACRKVADAIIGEALIEAAARNP